MSRSSGPQVGVVGESLFCARGKTVAKSLPQQQFQIVKRVDSLIAPAFLLRLFSLPPQPFILSPPASAAVFSETPPPNTRSRPRAGAAYTPCGGRGALRLPSPGAHRADGQVRQCGNPLVASALLLRLFVAPALSASLALPPAPIPLAIAISAHSRTPRQRLPRVADSAPGAPPQRSAAPILRICRKLQNRVPLSYSKASVYRHLGRVDKTPKSVMVPICDRSLWTTGCIASTGVECAEPPAAIRD